MTGSRNATLESVTGPPELRRPDPGFELDAGEAAGMNGRARRGPAGSPPPPPRGARALLFGLLWASSSWFYQSGGHNEAAHLDTARALVLDGQADIGRYAYNTADVVRWPPGEDGRLYSAKAPGLAVAAAPLVGFWHAVVSRFQPGDPVHWHVVVWLVTASLHGLLSALAGLLVFDTLTRLLASAAAALFGVVAVWVASPWFAFSTLFFSHVVTGSLVAIAFALLVRGRRLGLHPAGRPALGFGLAGFAAGYAVTTEHPAAILAGCLTLYAAGAVRHGSQTRAGAIRRACCFGLGAAAGGGWLLAYNRLVYGRAWFTPYQALAAQGAESAFPAQSLGLLGVHWPGFASLLDVLAAITVEPQRGLVYLGMSGGIPLAAAPVLLLAVPGLWLLRARGLGAEAATIAAASVLMLAFNGCYGDSIVYWGGGASLGPRHLVAALGLLALPVAAAGASRWKVAGAPLLAVSQFWMLLATAIEPRVPYESLNPYRDLYLGRWLAGRYGIARAGLFDERERRWMGDSTAGTPAKLLGVPGPWQLVPLLALWAGGGALLAWRCGARRAAVAAGLLPLAVAAVPPLRAAWAGRPPSGLGLLGRYWPGGEGEGEPLETRVDRELDFDWSADPPLLGAFRVEWTGTLWVGRPGAHRFRLESDDGSWLELDGAPVIDNGGEHAVRSAEATVELASGPHQVSVRYFNAFGGAVLRWWWTPPGGSEAIVPGEALAPAAPR